MNRSIHAPWLHRFAVLTALATLALIGAGGLVTSHGAGLAVPDWPTSYGYNMFLFPFSHWAGGIFYEHTHRLAASLVGLLTAVLAGWIWARETNGWPRRIGLAAILVTLGLMGVRTQGMFIVLACAAIGVIAYGFIRVGRDERPIRWWAAIAFSAVLVQGVLGGLRVTALKDELGIFHGALAQLFLVLISAIALVTSRAWQTTGFEPVPPNQATRLRPLLLLGTGLILAQLILGASMRHQHAGLAVPDFPLAYGKVWPALDAASVASYNQNRLETTSYNPITAAQIVLHLTHRIGAVAILVAVAAAAWRAHRTARGRFARLTWVWLALIVVQAILGAVTVWSNKAADVATLHVVTGAVSLSVGALLTLWTFHGADSRQHSAAVASGSRVNATPGQTQSAGAV